MNSFIAFVLLVAVIHMIAANSYDKDYIYKFEGNYKMPDGCENDNFCFIKGDKYPTDKIEKLLEKLPELKIRNPHHTYQLNERQGCDTQDECLSNTTYAGKHIYYIRDTDDIVRVVIQIEKKFEQIYNVQWCLKEGRITEDTTHFIKSSPTLTNFNVECVNTYIPYEFFVLYDDDEDDLQLEITRVYGLGIPVCCRCRVSKL